MTKEPTALDRVRAQQLAGFLRGFASLFRAFPNAELWGRPEEAEHAAGIMDQARDTLLALAETATTAPRGDGWQPIETAPKDGTHFLACRGYYSESWGFDQSPPMVVHYWDNLGEEGFYLSNGGGADDPPLDLTHWRPLPAAPRPVADGETGS